MTCVFVFYFKRRSLWRFRALCYLDIAIFSGMMILVVLVVKELTEAIQFYTVFRDPNKTLIFWSVFSVRYLHTYRRSLCLSVDMDPQGHFPGTTQ